MPVQYPAYLYIRVDRRLREDLGRAARAAGLSVSALARRTLAHALSPASTLDTASLGAEAAASLTMRNVRSAIR